MKVSVIIPVHNAEAYLRQCLDSLLNQTLKNIEIICVDDCSTDNSYEILKEYSFKDKRIILIKNIEQQGAGFSRNIGIKKANGEYLSILDADDFFEANMLEVVYNKCILADADIGIYNYKMYDDKTSKEFTYSIPFYFSQEWENKDFIINEYKEYLLTAVSHLPWNKMYKSRFVKNSGIEFQLLKCINDIFFCSMMLVCAKRIVYINEAFVHYRFNTKNQLTNNREKEVLASWIVLMEMKKFLLTHDLFIEYEKNFNEFVIYFLSFCLSSFKYESQKQLYNFLQDRGWEELGLSQCSPASFRLPWMYEQWKVLRFDLFNENTVFKSMCQIYADKFFCELRQSQYRRCILWGGGGKYGKAFLYQCKQNGYKLSGIIDQGKASINMPVDDYIIQDFDEIDLNKIDAVIIVNPNVVIDSMDEIQKKGIKVIDVGSYWKFGLPFEKCIY